MRQLQINEVSIDIKVMDNVSLRDSGAEPDEALAFDEIRVWKLRRGSASVMTVSLSSEVGKGSRSCLTFCNRQCSEALTRDSEYEVTYSGDSVGVVSLEFPFHGHCVCARGTTRRSEGS